MCSSINKIAVLDYSVGEVDIIEATESEIAQYGGVEEYLHQHCHYKDSEISWMDCTEKINFLSSNDFNE